MALFPQFLISPLMSLIATKVVFITYLARQTGLDFVGIAMYFSSMKNWKTDFFENSEASLAIETVWSSGYHFSIESRTCTYFFKYLAIFDSFFYFSIYLLYTVRMGHMAEHPITIFM